ncbi:hypothetical protein AURANDRAFT_32031, partial [Aureococcus anophagefferens]
ELGDVDAMVYLGGMYRYGLGVKLDKKKAARLFRMGADRGNATAQNNVAFLLDSEEKHEEGFPYYALAADQGFTPGEFNLGCCYGNGRGTEVDVDKARYWFERAAAKGHEGAIENLAYLDARDGSGVKLDKKKAERLYRMAADRGDAVAQHRIAWLLHSEKKFEEAVRYFVLAANQGYTSGEFNLGCCYMNGEGTEVDLGKARYWFERAAAKGYQHAMNELADLDARKGLGVKLDMKKAERLYRTAADRGSAFAQSNLGAVLHSEKKFDEAFPYFALAADQGYTGAESNLGVCYRDGDGTEVDVDKARYWFEHAAAKGYERAIESLARLDAQV